MSKSEVTKLKFLHGYRFNAEFDVKGMPDLVLDELKPLGENSAKSDAVTFDGHRSLP